MKLSKGALNFALKALKDLGATTEEIIPLRKSGSLDDIFATAANAIKRTKRPEWRGAPTNTGLKIRGAGEGSGRIAVLDDVNRASYSPRFDLTKVSRDEVRGKLREYDNFTGMMRELEPRWRQRGAQTLALKRLANEGGRGEALELLDTIYRSRRGPLMETRSLLTANQLLKKPGGPELAVKLSQASIPNPLVAARNILNAGLSDNQREIAIGLLGNGYGVDDAIELAKALS